MGSPLTKESFVNVVNVESSKEKVKFSVDTKKKDKKEKVIRGHSHKRGIDLLGIKYGTT